MHILQEWNYEIWLIIMACIAGVNFDTHKQQYLFWFEFKIFLICTNISRLYCIYTLSRPPINYFNIYTNNIVWGKYVWIVVKCTK